MKGIRKRWEGKMTGGEGTVVHLADKHMLEYTHAYGHTPFSNLEIPLTRCSAYTLKSHDPGLKPWALVLHSSSLQSDENATTLKVVMRKMWQFSLLPRTGSCCFSFWQPPSLSISVSLKFTFQHQSLLLTGSWLLIVCWIKLRLQVGTEGSLIIWAQLAFLDRWTQTGLSFNTGSTTYQLVGLGSISLPVWDSFSYLQNGEISTP